MEHEIMVRQNWAEYFLEIAQTVAKRSTCEKANVGAVIVSENKTILSTGYNGSLSGELHCISYGCELDIDNKCIRTIHAEQNAIAHAAKNGVKLEGARVYVTREPCIRCFKLMVQSGIKEIYFPHSPSRIAMNVRLSKDLDIIYDWI